MRVRFSAPRMVAACAATALVAFAGCSSSSDTISKVDEPSGDGDPSQSSLSWQDCDAESIAVEPEVFSSARAMGMECATVAVPVDHTKPDGRTIDLALARFAAADEENRIGSLVINPGGPGGSGLEFLAMAAMILPDELTDRFDVVSFDPRGLAASSPLECFTNEARAEWIDQDLDIDSTDRAAAEAETTEFETELLDGCTADDEELLANIGTGAVVDDLDQIRAALGDEQLTFLGMSYGTSIAAGYATKYPDNVRALVLDSPTTPHRSLATQSLDQQTGIANAITSFVQWCDATEPCPAGPDTAATIKTTATALDENPILADAASGTDKLDGSTFATAVITAMYDPSYSMPLAEAIVSLDAASPNRIEAINFLTGLAGMQHSKKPDGTYGNGFEIQTLVTCADADGPVTAQEAEQITSPLLPLFTDELEPTTSSCTIVPSGDTLEISTSDAADRILIIGTVGDPATPYQWTQQMADALGVTNVVTYNGSGHALSLTNACVNEQMVSFVIEPGSFSPTDCETNPDERDIFSVFGVQFEAMGLPASMTTCIVEELRSAFSPLVLAAANEAGADSPVVEEVSRIALGCR